MRRLVVLWALCAACGKKDSEPSPAPAPPPCPSASDAASATAWSKPPDPPPAVQRALDSALLAIASSDFAIADKQIASASELANGDAHLSFLVARTRATRFVAQGDLEHAADAVLSVVPTLAKHPELPDEFSAHNAMMMIREAQGDPAAALAENDQATLAAARGNWDPEGRELLAFQKDRWHRAYLTRMLAESRTGLAKQRLVVYAQAALDDYRTKGFPDSIAVLEAYFTGLDGNKASALAAAKKVDLAKDDDIEDLYLLVGGFEAGGDHASADDVRKIMRGSGPPRISKLIMLRWLDLDAKPTPSGFTPWHARP